MDSGNVVGFPENPPSEGPYFYVKFLQARDRLSARIQGLKLLPAYRKRVDFRSLVDM